MLRFHVQTYGCQMNVHDSRRIAEALRAAGYEAAEDPIDADVLVVNTCSVREKAVHKVVSHLGTLRPLKEARGAAIVVAGCVAQQEGERLLRRAPFVDLVVGPDRLAELPELLERARSAAAGATVATGFDTEAPRFLPSRPAAGEVGPTAFVAVMKGCDERCSFCIVPSTRGPERYRPAQDIVEEVRALVRAGAREVTLLGQTVNAWYDPAGDKPPRGSRRPPSRFPWLLRRIAAEVPDLGRLRYTSPHPRYLSEDLVAAHAELPVLARHVHLPVQSGSDRVLRRMLRRYRRAELLERIAALRAACPDLTLSTDLIVGFPGEREEDFEQTLSLVREAGFVQAFCFKYSPRPGTAALSLDGEVPEEVKEARLARLFEVMDELQGAHLRALVGRQATVLVEGVDRNGQATGRTERNEPCHFAAASPHELLGHFVRVRITRAFRRSLLGEPLDPALRPGVGRRLPVLGQ